MWWNQDSHPVSLAPEFRVVTTPSLPRHSSASTSMDWDSISKWDMCCLWNPETPPRCCVPFLAVGAMKCSKLFFTFHGVDSACSRTTGPLKMSLIRWVLETSHSFSPALCKAGFLPRYPQHLPLVHGIWWTCQAFQFNGPLWSSR